MEDVLEKRLLDIVDTILVFEEACVCENDRRSLGLAKQLITDVHKFLHHADLTNKPTPIPVVLFKDARLAARGVRS